MSKMDVDMWDEPNGSENTVSNLVRRYTAQWGLPQTSVERNNEIQKQISELSFMITSSPKENDFATKLQIEAWENEIKELKKLL